MEIKLQTVVGLCFVPGFHPLLQDRPALYGITTGDKGTEDPITGIFENGAVALADHFSGELVIGAYNLAHFGYGALHCALRGIHLVGEHQDFQLSGHSDLQPG